MSQTEILSVKLVKRTYADWGRKSFQLGCAGPYVLHEHWCPGCENMHMVAVDQPFRTNGAQWRWNGDVLAPTFEPSMNIGPGTKLQCHYFLRAGRIEFLPDCHHRLAGQTVDLPDIPTEWLL